MSNIIIIMLDGVVATKYYFLIYLFIFFSFFFWPL